MTISNLCVSCFISLLSGFTYPLAAQHHLAKPDDSRFSKVVLDNDLNEPMEVAVAPDGIIYYIERPGWVNRLDPRTNTKTRLAKLPVRFKGEDGLIGMALDPDFFTNRFMYLYFGDSIPVDTTWYNVLARFEVSADSLLQATRHDLLRIPVTPEGVSHSAGSLAFDRNGNLYLATGDNTNPFQSGGFAPIDGRPDRATFDAQRSAANTNDLRGKILRIHPEPDGSYTIPAGNLFPPGTPKTRPEVYVMGCRNPYRINLDPATDVLYWGEVGPDAGRDSTGRGSRGYDEFNRAARAGNFGWPYFIGNSRPYNRVDFGTNQPGGAFNPLAPLNQSANNTGLEHLPPANAALIWYPYDQSPEFPLLGTGGRNAIGGPIFRPPASGGSPRQFPAYYEGAWFVADWMRNWIVTARLDSLGQLTRLEPFLPRETFSKPIDMTFGPDGALYLLEYGTYWRAKNTDARLSRIDFSEGNRTPVASITATKTVGAAPLRITFSARRSFDYDQQDSLKYAWQFTDSGVQSRRIDPTFTFNKPGQYPVKLTVTDTKGATATTSLLIRVGNEPPQVAINLAGNRTFYFSRQPIPYSVAVRDREDGVLGQSIPTRQVQVRQQYLETGYDVAALDAADPVKTRGQLLLENSDCRACHATDKLSVGPSFRAIALRYDASATPGLAQKILRGGGGNWGGEHVMSAHPQLTVAEATVMVDYILSLKKQEPDLALNGAITPNQLSGSYVLTARYTDKGGLMGTDAVLLRPARVAATEANQTHGIARRNLSGSDAVMAYNESGAWLSWDKIDLTGIRSLSARTRSTGLTGTIEVRLDSVRGPLIGQLAIGNGEPKEQTPVTFLKPTTGLHTVYFVYHQRAGGISIWRRLEAVWFEFSP